MSLDVFAVTHPSVSLSRRESSAVHITSVKRTILTVVFLVVLFRERFLICENPDFPFDILCFQTIYSHSSRSKLGNPLWEICGWLRAICEPLLARDGSVLPPVKFHTRLGDTQNNPFGIDGTSSMLLLPGRIGWVVEGRTGL